MKTRCKKIAVLAPAVLLATVLASCGGGGVSGGSVAGNAATFEGIVAVDPGNTYASNNSQVSAGLTAVRQGGQGAGFLRQDASLDLAASRHADFLVNNNLASNSVYLNQTFGGILGGHFEDSALPGFSGASPQARATAAGYAGTVTELMTFGAASGTDCMASLGNSVYHLTDLISPFVDLGISFNAGSAGGSVCAIVLGVKSTTLGQLPSAGPVVYPFDTQTGVPPRFYNAAEVPDPAPDLQTPLGHPVIASLYTLASPTLNGSDIVIHTFSITPAGGGALAVRVLAKAGVTSNGPALTVDAVIPRAGFVVLLPTAPLVQNTTYNLSFSATVKGQGVSKTWSFTTGPNN